MIDHIDGLLMKDELEALEKLYQNFDQFDEQEMDRLIDEMPIIKLGGQDCSSQSKGSFTGDISAEMLKDVGAKYVILGHSERRQYYFESDEIIAQKIINAVENGLTPILCVGESLQQRQNGNHQDFIINQLQNSLIQNKIDNLIIAYEPIWSIGSGAVPTIAEIEEITSLIISELSKNKNIVDFKVIYGGSVNSNNAREILQTKNINGLLVGGASLNEDEFYKIIKCNQ